MCYDAQECNPTFSSDSAIPNMNAFKMSNSREYKLHLLLLTSLFCRKLPSHFKSLAWMSCIHFVEQFGSVQKYLTCIGYNFFMLQLQGFPCFNNIFSLFWLHYFPVLWTFFPCFIYRVFPVFTKFHVVVFQRAGKSLL